ncbi:uncharacterized protein LOC122386354 isoform X2 [Amphibalanus amphitrite]|nr:uncharacterized protein LOC122386354 isoform X2 [Amphibalanus amphitrite]
MDDPTTPMDDHPTTTGTAAPDLEPEQREAVVHISAGEPSKERSYRQHQPSSSTDIGHQRHTSDKTGLGVSVECRLRRIEESLLEVKQTLKGGQRESRVCADKDTEARINSARDMDSLLEAVSDHRWVAMPDRNIVVCELCVPNMGPEVELDRNKNNVHGICRYTFSAGTSFPRPMTIPKPFTRLKESVKHHIASKRHRDAVEKAKRDSAHAETRERLRQSACRNSLMAAYHVMKHSLARVMYENTIVLCDLTGSKMGDLCHSGPQMQRFRHAFSDVVLDHVARYVERMPCVGIVADKVTVQHRTVDITGILTLVPEAHCDELIQSFVIGAPVVAHHDGESLAEEWVNTVKRVNIQDTAKIAAVCTDGQYHGADVPAKFLAKLQSSHSDYAARSRSPSVPCLWDNAHLLDLAESSARRELSSKWVDDVVDAISRVVKRFSYGKGREVFIAAGKRMGIETRGLLLWSETRFSPHAANVIEAFVTNLPVLAVALEDQLVASCASAGSRTVQQAEIKQDIKLLKDASFRARLLALLDLYSVMSRTSKSLQNLQLLPWQRQNTYEEMVNDLGEKRKKLGFFQQRGSAAMSALQIQEMLQEGDDDDMAAFWPNLSKCGTNLPQSVVKEILAFTRALESHCASREHGVDARGRTRGCHNLQLKEKMVQVRQAADLERLQQSPTSSAITEVGRALSALQHASLIPTAPIPWESVAATFKELKSMQHGTNQKLFKELWLRDDHRLLPYLSVVARLWLLSPSESVVESMASVVKAVFGVSSSRVLDHGNAEKELIVRWNGPSVPQADGLIAAVVQKYPHLDNFVRSTLSQQVEGKVIARHKAHRCAKSHIYPRTAPS